MSDSELPRCDVYIDETSQSNHRYLVIGGIAVATADFKETHEALWAARRKSLPQGCMKWTKVSRTKLPAYEGVVDKFFELQRSQTLDLHALVVDTTKQKHHLFNQGSREIGFNKELYQLIMKFGRLYSCLFHVYPDRRSTNQRTEDLRLMLNRGIRLKGDKRDWPFRRLQFREPEDSMVLQLADVLIGSIAFRLNGHDKKSGASAAKIHLSGYILKRAGIKDVFRDTAIRGSFTIWHRQLQ